MKIQNLEYSEFLGTSHEWKFSDCSFNDINLIVGKNASGKTRTLSVVESLANLVSKDVDLIFSDGQYVAEFQNDQRIINYSIEYHNREIVSEILKIDNDIKLNRDTSTTGKIFSEQINDFLRFEVSPNRVAVLAKKDNYQHPFIEDIYKWGKGVVKYNFGSTLGQGQLVVKEISQLNPNNNAAINQNAVSALLKGKEKMGDNFVQMIIEDMSKIGYEINEIGIMPLPTAEIITIGAPIINMPLGIYVKEKGVDTEIFQAFLSQGMFRALSLLIQINYSFIDVEPSCILIDDISEGLDYERSSSLIKILCEKAKISSVQLVMSTNDRFVMNSIPFDYWIILDRKGKEITLYNYRNSKEMFDDFEATGFNNFDILSMGYYNKKGKK